MQTGESLSSTTSWNANLHVVIIPGNAGGRYCNRELPARVVDGVPQFWRSRERKVEEG